MRFIRAVSIVLLLSLISSFYSVGICNASYNLYQESNNYSYDFVSNIVSDVLVSLNTENDSAIADKYRLDKYHCNESSVENSNIFSNKSSSDAYVYLPCVFGGYQYYGVDIESSVSSKSLVIDEDISDSKYKEWVVSDNRFYNKYLDCFAPYSLLEYSEDINRGSLSSFELLLKNEQLDFRYDNDKELIGYNYKDACDKFDDVYVEIKDDVAAYVILEDFKGDWCYIEFDADTSISNNCFMIKKIVYYDENIIDELSFYKEDYYRDEDFILSRYTGRVINPAHIVINEEYRGSTSSLKSLRDASIVKYNEKFL